MEDITEVRKACFEAWAVKYSLEIADLEASYEKHRKKMMEFPQNRDLSPSDFEDRCLNTFQDTVFNETSAIVYQEAVFTGVDDIQDFDGNVCRKIIRDFKEFKDPERRKMIADGLVMTTDVTIDGKSVPVAVSEILEHEISKDGIYIVTKGVEWVPGKDIVPRNSVQEKFGKKNRDYSHPLKPNPRMNILGVLKVNDLVYRRFRMPVYGNDFCYIKSPKFAGRLPFGRPIALRATVNDESSTEGCIMLKQKDFEYSLWSDEDINSHRWTYSKFLAEAAKSGVVQNLTLRMLKDFFNKNQVARTDKGDMKIKKSKNPKYGDTIVLDDNVFAFGEFRVLKSATTKTGKPYVTVSDATSMISGQDTFNGNLRSFMDVNELPPQSYAKFCFRVQRSDTHWSSEAQVSEARGLGQGDCKLEILGFVLSSTGVKKETEQKEKLSEEDLD